MYTLSDYREGLRRLCSGEQINLSTSIADTTTYGYGKLDANGFWQYPVDEEMAEFAHQRRDLLAALKEARCWMMPDPPYTYGAKCETAGETINMIDAAIARAEKGERPLIKRGESS